MLSTMPKRSNWTDTIIWDPTVDCFDWKGSSFGTAGEREAWLMFGLVLISASAALCGLLLISVLSTMPEEEFSRAAKGAAVGGATGAAVSALGMGVGGVCLGLTGPVGVALVAAGAGAGAIAGGVNAWADEKKPAKWSGNAGGAGLAGAGLKAVSQDGSPATYVANAATAAGVAGIKR